MYFFFFTKFGTFNLLGCLVFVASSKCTFLLNVLPSVSNINQNLVVSSY